MGENQSSKGHILLVDDESSVLESLKMFFEDEGYETTTATDGAAAIECLNKESYDLVITDIYMPNMSGIELLKATKAQYPHTEVILITGFGSKKNEKTALNLGAYAYITKPFNVVSLLKTVFECLDKTKQNKST